ncbi:unnamed protein product, partial [Allacma fusca]
MTKILSKLGDSFNQTSKIWPKAPAHPP